LLSLKHVCTSNRGESVHQLQRAIYTGKVALERGRRRDEMIAISGSLTLLTNLVIAWNTQRMQTTLDDWQRKGQGIDDDWLRRLLHACSNGSTIR
jgi:TnpA family transposase